MLEYKFIWKDLYSWAKGTPRIMTLMAFLDKFDLV
jgi:hypothetical protein